MNNNNYYNYGGRGITVCERWLDFMNFKEDMYNSYLEHINNFGEQDTTLDRIDVNGNYEPSNCRWADIYEQENNKRDNIVLTYNGMTKTLPEWARYLDLPYSTLANRYRRKKPIAEILYPKKLR